MYLQNKQENGGGVLAASSIPKLDQGIWRVKESVFFNKECRTSLIAIPPSFIGEEDDPIFMEIGDFLPKRKGKEGVLCAP